jgi:hypothetical protein
MKITQTLGLKKIAMVISDSRKMLEKTKLSESLWSQQARLVLELTHGLFQGSFDFV